MFKAFPIYALTTLLVTFYSLYNLYLKEGQIFVISIIIANSKFYFCLLLNFVIMILILCWKIIIKIFFNEVRESEFIVECFKIASYWKNQNEIFNIFNPFYNIQTKYWFPYSFCGSIIPLYVHFKLAYF